VPLPIQVCVEPGYYFCWPPQLAGGHLCGDEHCSHRCARLLPPGGGGCHAWAPGVGVLAVGLVAHLPSLSCFVTEASTSVYVALCMHICAACPQPLLPAGRRLYQPLNPPHFLHHLFLYIVWQPAWTATAMVAPQSDALYQHVFYMISFSPHAV